MTDSRSQTAIPTRIGRYRVETVIGYGGMGIVLAAYDPAIDRTIAIKIIRPELAFDDKIRARFIREARAAGRLHHPNIVAIYDVGEHEGQPFIAMEYLPGHNLSELIEQRVSIPFLQKMHILMQVCDALAYAHAHGVIHRDIKPSNIRILPDGRVKVMDFGVAKLVSERFTQTQVLMGTPHYMSPEQVRDEKERIDHRTDIFALGVVLFELMTYHRPFEGEHPTAVAYKIVHEDPPRLSTVAPDLPFVEDLERIVMRALAKDPETRYGSARAVLRDLEVVAARFRQQHPELREQMLLHGIGERPLNEVARQKTIQTPPILQETTASDDVHTGSVSLDVATPTAPPAAPSTVEPSTASVESSRQSEDAMAERVVRVPDWLRPEVFSLRYWKTHWWSALIFLWGLCLIIGVGWLMAIGYDYYSLPFHDRPTHPYDDILRSRGTIGHTLGLIGAIMIFFNFSYLLRKQKRIFRSGPLDRWLDFHMMTGITAWLVLTFHSAFHVSRILAVAYYGLLVVVATGLIGRYIYAHIPKSMGSHIKSLRELNSEFDAIARRLRELQAPLDGILAIIDSRQYTGVIKGKQGLRVLPRLVLVDLKYAIVLYTVREFLRTNYRPEDAQRVHMVQQLTRQMAKRAYWIAIIKAVQNLMGRWRVVHRTLAWTLVALFFVHMGLVYLFVGRDVFVELMRIALPGV